MNKAYLRQAVATCRGDAREISGIALRVVLTTAVPSFIIGYLSGFNPAVLFAIMVVSWTLLVILCFIAGEYQALVYKDANIEPDNPTEDDYTTRTRTRMPRDFDGQRIKHSEQREGQL